MFLFREAHMYLIISVAIVVAMVSMFVIKRFELRSIDGKPITFKTMNNPDQLVTLVRHEAECPSERSTCGWRHRLISREDSNVAAWAHAVDIDGAREHYHKVSTELYYVLDGEGVVMLDGVEHPVRRGSLVHIPPDVVHGAKGKMRVLVVGIPDIADEDLYLPPHSQRPAKDKN